jgi:hypothetical protein
MATWEQVMNGTVSGGGITWAVANNGTLLNYSNALNNTLMQQANWNATNISYREIINHTFYNSTNVFFGINTSTPQNQLNVIGDINATLDIWVYRTLNLTSGYLYATNGTFLTTETFWNANASNFTTLYGNQLGNASNFTTNYGHILGWANNASNFTTLYGNQYTNWTNVTGYARALAWQGNATNFTTIYSGLLGNYTSGPWQSNASNFTTLYGNQYTNWTNVTGYARALAWQGNATNFTTIYGYAINKTYTENSSLNTSYITNGTGGAYIYHNGTGWCIGGC